MSTDMDPVLVAKGKVRDIYSTSDPETLLFVASDRVSAFDIIMKNVGNNGRSFSRRESDFNAQSVPNKGKLLTSLSKFWFDKLGHILQNHFITSDLDKMPEGTKQWGLRNNKDLEGRTMLVRKCQVLKCEAIVRGYLTGKS